MPTTGAIFGSRFGGDRRGAYIANNNGVVSYTAIGTTLDAGVAFRFTALSTKDVKSVRIYWVNAATPKAVLLTVETIGTATGKPTGTLYDANASFSIATPTVGVQTYTFATPPTTGLTVGVEYAIVLANTGGAGSQSIGLYINETGYGQAPTAVMSGTNITTRSNLTVISNGTPPCSIIWDDDTEDAVGFMPFYSYTTNAVYGARGVGMLFTTPIAFNVAGFYMEGVNIVGTPAGALRFRLFDASNNTISGTTVSVNPASASSRAFVVQLPAVISLPAGTYRLVVDSADSTITNGWSIRSIKFMHANAVPNNFRLTSCLDIGAPSWTPSTTDNMVAGLLLDDIPTAAGGGLLTHPSMTGGIRG